MKRGFVLDTTVILKYASHEKIYRLFNIVSKYSIIIYINDTLITELRRNLPKVIKNQTIDYEIILEQILDLTINFDTIEDFKNSPDPKDNFLFDLALQTNSEVIVSDEKLLLNFMGPVPIRSLKWFKETFPIEL